MPQLKLDRSLAMFEQAKRLSPGGVMGIRRPHNFVEGEYPIFVTHGYGGHVVDVALFFLRGDALSPRWRGGRRGGSGRRPATAGRQRWPRARAGRG